MIYIAQQPLKDQVKRKAFRGLVNVLIRRLLLLDSSVELKFIFLNIYIIESYPDTLSRSLSSKNELLQIAFVRFSSPLPKSITQILADSTYDAAFIATLFSLEMMVQRVRWLTAVNL